MHPGGHSLVMGCTSDLIRASWLRRRNEASVRLAHAEHTSTAATEGIAGHQGLCIWSPGSISSLSLTFTPISSVLGQAPTSSCLNFSSIISGLAASPTSTPSQGWWLQRECSQMPIPQISSLTGSLTPTCLKLPQDLALPTSAVQPLDRTSCLPASCFSTLV